LATATPAQPPSYFRNTFGLENPPLYSEDPTESYPTEVVHCFSPPQVYSEPTPYVAEVKVSDDGAFLIHYISSKDTLVGISLKYNVKVDDIKRANNLFTGSLNERETLIILGVSKIPKDVEDPTDEMKEERERQRVTKRFQLATKCVSPEEAKFYLEDCAFNVDEAIKRYKEDTEWASKHPCPSSSAPNTHFRLVRPKANTLGYKKKDKTPFSFSNFFSIST